MTSRQAIADFLAQKRIAIVGVSCNPKDFSRTLLREFVTRGYDVIPVHPGVNELDGKRCYAHVKDIAPPVDAVLVMTGAAASGGVVRDCFSAGVRRIWLFRATGAGAVSPEAVAMCRAQGVSLVEGYCPLMFFPHTGFLHQLHGIGMRIVRTYPA